MIGANGVSLQAHLFDRIGRRCRAAVSGAERPARTEAEIRSYMRDLDMTLSAISEARVHSRIVEAETVNRAGSRRLRVEWSSHRRRDGLARACAITITMDRSGVRIGMRPFAGDLDEAALDHLTRAVVTELFDGRSDAIGIGRGRRSSTHHGACSDDGDSCQKDACGGEAGAPAS